jgi:hypothetical protein
MKFTIITLLGLLGSASLAAPVADGAEIASPKELLTRNNDASLTGSDLTAGTLVGHSLYSALFSDVLALTLS